MPKPTLKKQLVKILRTRKKPKRPPYISHRTISVDAWMVVDKHDKLGGSWGFYDDFHIFSSPEQAHWAVFGYYDDADPNDYRVVPVTISYDLSKAEKPQYNR